ncbi:MAG: regulatory protein RecX [Chloroflexota bacterium]
MQAALRYLGYRSRSEVEVRQYLRRRGCQPATADRVIDKLRSFHYLDDDAFARSWALARAQGRGYGPRRIDQELRKKGLSQALIRSALKETFDQVDEAASAKRFLAKRFKGENLREPRTQQRAAAYLQRRGYDSKVIFDLLHYSIEED